jgi:hypothetical protein
MGAVSCAATENVLPKMDSAIATKNTHKWKIPLSIKRFPLQENRTLACGRLLFANSIGNESGTRCLSRHALHSDAASTRWQSNGAFAV